MFVGVNITFFPMHFLGLAGMPRRIPDYPDAFIGWNYIASLGSIISLVSTVLFLYIVYDLLTNEVEASDGADVENEYFISRWSTKYAQTLEWSLTSPPGFHCYNSLPTFLTK